MRDAFRLLIGLWLSAVPTLCFAQSEDRISQERSAAAEGSSLRGLRSLFETPVPATAAPLPLAPQARPEPARRSQAVGTPARTVAGRPRGRAVAQTAAFPAPVRAAAARPQPRSPRPDRPAASGSAPSAIAAGGTAAAPDRGGGSFAEPPPSPAERERCYAVLAAEAEFSDAEVAGCRGLLGH